MISPPDTPARNLEALNQREFADEYDVIVVGSGAAGLYAALCLPDALRVLLITKDTLDRSASDWAQGGIAAAIAPDDSPLLHVEDTLKAGAGLCDPEAVTFLANHAADCVRSLVSMGVAFDRKGPDLALTLEAAHSRRRVLHAADTTGRAIISTLMEQIHQSPHLEVLSEAFVNDLWMTPDGSACRGVSLIHEQQLIWLSARAVVLATGGGGQVFSQTTNPEVSTGDGVAMAWRAGAVLRDLEFFQFHPTALTQPGAPRFLISEAVRGEGAHLIDATGHRFAFDYHPAGELAPRDVVSRAIFNHLRQQSPTAEPDSPVWLDLRPIPPDTIRHRFPNIIRVCQRWGIDVFEQPIPVAPAAHYWMGGIAVDLKSQSSIQGLYAVGETASTGVHGANRLASNSLLECLVFGAQLQTIELPPARSGDEFSPTKISVLSMSRAEVEQQATTVAEIRRSLPSLIWRCAGISREQGEMVEAIAQVRQWRDMITALPISTRIASLHPNQPLKLSSPEVSQLLRDWSELHNLLDIAWLILRSANTRTESRGGHYRRDYPETRSPWQVHTLIQGETIEKSSAIAES